MAKRSKAANMKAAAAILGSRGGDARRRALSKGRREEIAAEGGRAKAAKNK